MPKNAVCAELGVFRGDFSAEILTRCQPKKLFLVDIWDGMMSSGDRLGEGVRWIYLNTEIHNVRRRFVGHPQVELVKSDSVRFLTSHPDTLDWCYIDTDHTYELTQRELLAAVLAVKSGGFICGHDYCDLFLGVVQAVDEFCQQRSLNPEIWNSERFASYKIQI